MAQCGIPMEHVPKDAEPISEEQFERLPDYVTNLMADSFAGKLIVTSRAEVEDALQHYFQRQLDEKEDETLAGKREIDLVSNSPLDEEMSMEEHET
jgi:hypothetical protein